MNDALRQITITHVVDAPRELVFQAFTDPDHLAAWWGPIGNSLPREQMEFDVRPGGYQRWTEVVASDPDLRVHVFIDLTDVADGELLEGLIHVGGRLQEGIAPFDTRFRIEFHEQPDGRTRLEIHQWLPEHLAAPAEQGWREGLSKLDILMAQVQAPAPTIEE